jgi:hypothetical protein
MNTYQVGDVVTLASNTSWPMTVTQIITPLHIEIIWLDEKGEAQSRWIASAALKPYNNTKIGLPTNEATA